MLALQLIEKEPVGSHGFPMSVATDPANEFRFRADEMPTVDHAARALGLRQEAYYSQHDTKDKPLNRAGHLWSVHLSDSTPKQEADGPDVQRAGDSDD